LHGNNIAGLQISLQLDAEIRYLNTCPKNDVISFFRKRFCALDLGLEFEVELRLELGFGLKLAEIHLNTLSDKRSFGQIY